MTQKLVTELKLKQAFPSDLKEQIGSGERLKNNFLIYVYDAENKFIHGPILLNLSMNLELLSTYLKRGIIYIPQVVINEIPLIDGSKLFD